jgi:hypothetical protein
MMSYLLIHTNIRFSKVRVAVGFFESSRCSVARSAA